jgi:hypothetical protein
MIAITPQMRVLVAIEPADFRRYADKKVMRRVRRRARICAATGSISALHNGRYF